MNRLMYDECAYHDQVQRSQTPFMYTTDIIQFQNPRSCLAGHGVVGGATVTSAPIASFVDVESALMNRMCPASKCAPASRCQPDMSKLPPPQPMCVPFFDRPFAPSSTGLPQPAQSGPRVILQSL